jgi:hypothetical protein
VYVSATTPGEYGASGGGEPAGMIGLRGMDRSPFSV